ncbi:hypothetical protein GGR57DRAFT_481768 [Xylariaceae sp. FL1272]|nr:hypothetical protein GGR57DRAFT_481768 [Xylariaceae sp. FL1272]
MNPDLWDSTFSHESRLMWAPGELVRYDLASLPERARDPRECCRRDVVVGAPRIQLVPRWSLFDCHFLIILLFSLSFTFSNDSCSTSSLRCHKYESMRTSIRLVLASLISVVTSVSTAGTFYSPPESEANQDFSNNPIYVIDQDQTIKYTTFFENYTINLWHQSLTGQSAKPGPAVFSTTNGAVSQFTWNVQVYQFDLSISNVFFLWLTSASDSRSLSSHYFNITDKPLTSSTTAVTSSTTSTVAATTTTSLPTQTSSTSTPPSASGLSTGAQAGIGVGASLVGIAAVIIAIVSCRRSRHKRPGNEIQESQQNQITEANESGAHTQAYNRPKIFQAGGPGFETPPKTHHTGRSVFEMPPESSYSKSVELPASQSQDYNPPRAYQTGPSVFDVPQNPARNHLFTAELPASPYRM